MNDLWDCWLIQCFSNLGLLLADAPPPPQVPTDQVALGSEVTRVPSLGLEIDLGK